MSGQDVLDIELLVVSGAPENLGSCLKLLNEIETHLWSYARWSRTWGCCDATAAAAGAGFSSMTPAGKARASPARNTSRQRFATR
jgi:hypothetical protein